MVDNPFLVKMRTHGDLDGQEVDFVRSLCQRRETVHAGTELAPQGSNPEVVWIMLSGLACRHKSLEEGERQIVAFLVPGDLCDLQVAMLGRMDHTIEAMVESSVATITVLEVREILNCRPALTRALLMANLIDLATVREWVVNNGRRAALARVAHLLWELYLRHAAVGLVTDHMYRLPITQRDLADATSLSNVHVSRTLTRLREEGVLQWSARTVEIKKPERLREIAGFDPDYLHGAGQRTEPHGLRDA